MSSPIEHSWLESEAATLTEMLASLPADRILERIGLESRLKEVQEELRRSQFRKQASAVLRFTGEPVVGSIGIDAKFAASVMGRFDQLIRQLLPKSAKPKKEEGKAPEPQPVLHLTALIPGSFGLELRELQGGLLEGSSVAAVIDEAIDLVNAAAANDDSFADALSTRDKRVGSTLRDFLITVAHAGASLQLQTADRELPLDRKAAKLAAKRADQVRVDQHEFEVIGQFWALPGSRTFELRDESGDEVRGLIAESIRLDDAMKLVSRRCLATVRVATFNYPGKTLKRHALMRLRPA